ncbi:MAG TPA: amidohydrolase family protein [Tepidisphaeraceae bacterium]|nr:amidohydrolase family protein [Tepidisphaeraceae bacterium]
MPAILYDVHTHIGLDTGFYLRRWWPYAANVQELLGHMDAAGIGRAVCFPFTLPSAFDPYAFAERKAIELLPGRHPFDRENELLSVEVARLDRDKRLLQFGMFDPSRQVALQVKSLEKLIGVIAGLKTQTTVLQSPIRDLLDGARDIISLAQQHDLPVLIHTAVNPIDAWAQVRDCLDVAESFPRVRFNLAHSLRFDREWLQRAASMPNVSVDCSAHLVHCILATKDAPPIAPRERRVDADYSQPVEVLGIIHEMLRGRYLWGSDYPYMSWCDDNMSAVYSYTQEADVLHALPARIRDDMAGAAPEAWLFGERRNG